MAHFKPVVSLLLDHEPNKAKVPAVHLAAALLQTVPFNRQSKAWRPASRPCALSWGKTLGGIHELAPGSAALQEKDAEEESDLLLS